jgi:hypothetical protein
MRILANGALGSIGRVVDVMRWRSGGGEDLGHGGLGIFLNHSEIHEYLVGRSEPCALRILERIRG